MRSLKILHFTTTDLGGGGMASLYLSELFNKHGYTSRVIIKTSKSKNTGALKIYEEYSSYLLHRTGRFASAPSKPVRSYLLRKKTDPKYCFFNLDESQSFTSTRKLLSKLPYQPDVIILHWVSFFLNSKTIAELAAATGAKIYWIMTDNAPLTGGCHFPWDCKGYEQSCRHCPAILNENSKKQAEINFGLKNKFLPENLGIVACSSSDLYRAQRSTLFKNNSKHHIFLPVDESRFKPGDKVKARMRFGLSAESKVIFYGAVSFSEPRKGCADFIKAIAILKDQLPPEDKQLHPVILLAGQGNTEAFSSSGLKVVQTGFLNEEDLILAYQASDIFVSTSLEDSGPLMINQSVMCGTPVVSYKTGVAPDLVIPEQTGFLAETGSPSDLAQGIQYFIKMDKKKYEKIAYHCRQLACNNYSLDKTIQNWIDLIGK